MQELYVFGFMSGGAKIILAAHSLEHAALEAFARVDPIDNGFPFYPLNYCEIEWGSKVMQAQSLVRH